MSLPVLTKTWQGSYDNQVLALGSALLDNQTTLLAIKNALLGLATNPPTIGYSCSSTVAGAANDGVDRWATTANLVWAAAGTAHSWFVFKQPGVNAGFQYLISLEVASGTGSVITFVRSPSAGFTGGSTTARPTATDEVIDLAGVNYGGVTSDVSQRWTVMQSTDGQSTRILWCNSALFQGMWLIEKPLLSVTGWTNPSLGFAAVPPFSLAAFATNAVASAIGRARNGAVCNVTMLCEGFSTVSLPADSAIGNIANEIDSGWIMAPIAFAGLTPGNRGRHGTLNDIWFGSATVVSGDSYPITGTQLFAQFGCFIFPWNGGGIHLS